MKKKAFQRLQYALIAVFIGLITVSCSNDDDEENALAPYASLFSKTDYFIDMLDTVYEHYDALGKRTSDSSDGKFTVTPIGRMIVVKKKAGASSMTYDEVENALNIHYKNHRKVNSVYKNNGGTITIDCRK
ncbi:MAG: hypothetical protein IKQ05_02885 [Prevotella sp.]|nr:hypothetical protein [Prevotella sp.]